MSHDDKNKENELELDHEYDGIKELDNPLPRWWLISFYGAIIFGICYFFYYVVGGAPTLRDEYNKEQEVHHAVRAEYLAKLGAFDVEHFEKIYTNESVIQYGESLYVANCMSCHADGGKGDIGPNLTDRFWLFSFGNPETVYPFILSGNPNGGMPSWSDKIEKEDIYAILAYVLNQQGKTYENAKQEEGNEFPPWKPGMRTEDYF
ncbi:c-type cytochrome [bacterium]|nr:c-type cytochrome [bacterium]